MPPRHRALHIRPTSLSLSPSPNLISPSLATPPSAAAALDSLVDYINGGDIPLRWSSFVRPSNDFWLHAMRVVARARLSLSFFVLSFFVRLFGGWVKNAGSLAHLARFDKGEADRSSIGETVHRLRVIGEHSAQI